MSNSFFQFKQFIIHQDQCAMKVTTDACLFGAWVANGIQKKSIVKTVLDIGTGTGLLSLMIAQKNRELKIDSVEIDAKATKQAKDNAASSPWNQAIRIFNDDVKKFKPGTSYDLIISNPPFYENELQSENKQKNIAYHSKNLTLDDLLNVIKQNISANGDFYLLLPFKRNEEIATLLHKYGFSISHKVNVRQTINHGFFRIMIKAGLQSASLIEEEISIKDNNQQYTKQFTRLLEDYYLYL
ncbi:MAG: methyltransferase [Bacteroidetes bacterium]|nr:methyltransferase [Bacteroidota bacterium]